MGVNATLEIDRENMGKNITPALFGFINKWSVLLSLKSSSHPTCVADYPLHHHK